MGVSRLASGNVCGSQISDAIDDGLLPLAEDEVSANEPPTFAFGSVPFAIIHAELMQRVSRVGMIGVEKERAIGVLRIKDALLVQAGAVELEEIIFWKQLLTLGALHLPRPF